MALDPYFVKVKFIHSIALKLFLMLFFFSIALVVLVLVLLSVYEGQYDQMMIIIPAVFVLSALMALVLSLYISAPIKKAMKALRGIARGEAPVDISSRRKDELGNLILILNATLRKLREAELHARDVANMKSNFVTIAAHQLRTPSTGIKWAVDSLSKDSSLPAETKSVVGQMGTAIDQIVAIINDLLSTAKLEASLDDYTMAPVDIIELINTTIAQEQLRAREKHIQIAFHNNTYKDSLLVNIDRSRISMALSNLIDNAVRYNQQNGFVEILLENKAEGIEIIIKDTGIGIPQPEQNKIFTQFYRATNAVAIEPNGSGIGLFITKSVIEHHQGKIWFETEEGKGTTFHMMLPLTQPQQ